MDNYLLEMRIGPKIVSLGIGLERLIILGPKPFRPKISLLTGPGSSRPGFCSFLSIFLEKKRDRERERGEKERLIFQSLNQRFSKVTESVTTESNFYV